MLKIKMLKMKTLKMKTLKTKMLDVGSCQSSTTGCPRKKWDKIDNLEGKLSILSTFLGHPVDLRGLLFALLV